MKVSGQAERRSGGGLPGTNLARYTTKLLAPLHASGLPRLTCSRRAVTLSSKCLFRNRLSPYALCD